MGKQKVSFQLLQLENLLASQNADITDNEDLKREIFRCKNNFYGTIERNILLAKKKISEQMHSLSIKMGQQLADESESALLRSFKNKLNVLNGDIDYLLNQGLLALYMELNDLRKQSLRFKAGGFMPEIVKIAIDSLSNLLKQYFVFQEYQIRRKISSKQKQISIFSLRSIPLDASIAKEESNSEKIDQQILREAQQFIQSKPLPQLFDLEMKKQEQKMTEGVQICRICSQQIKMINIEKHVYNCAKKSQLKMELQSKNQQINNLEQTLKVLFSQSCQQYTHQKIDEQFRRICKLILHPERKVQRVLHRRSSLIGLKSQKNLHNKIQNCIVQYIDNYGQHIILSNLLKCFNERSLIERGINHLEMTNLMSDHQQVHSIFEKRTKKTEKNQRKNSKKNTCIMTSPSHFYQIQSVAEKDKIQKSQKIINKRKGSVSSKKTESLQKSDKIQDDHQMEILITKRSLSRKNQQSPRHNELNQIKQYSSLHNINPSLIKNELQQSSIRLNSFQILKFLGQGAFGKVYMVRRKETKDVYALKIIKISQNYGQKQLQSIKNQNQIFKKIAGDHLVKAPFSFNQQSSHIFILQYMPGGDLRKVLKDEVYLEEEGAKFYLAQIILAIEYLHKHNIIHRDLKPQNLVIDRMGHLKLTDFGLSEFQVHEKLKKTRKQDEMNEKQRSESRKTRKRRTALYGVNKKNIKLIGTPDYIAPQIINQTSLSNYTIDWWSLGVMAYEMIIGTRPFCGDSIQEIIDNITSFNIEWPEVGFEEGMITPEAKDFIVQLLNKDFVNRLGANGAQQLKSHPFLKGIDWENLKSSTPTVLPRNVTKTKDLVNLKQDPTLRKEVQEFIKNGKEKLNKMRLKTFIRFDLLRSETIQNVEKKQQQTTKKLNRLRTLKEITNEIQQSVEGYDQ